MKKLIILRVFALFVILSLACNIFTGVQSEGDDQGGTVEPATEPTTEPLTVTGNGPSGFTAEVTSADSVRLSWQAVEGATVYHVVASANGGKSFPVIDLDATATSYEDFIVFPNSQLTYAIEAANESGSIGQSIVNVTTPVRQPNPLTVQALFDKKKSTTANIGPEGGNISVKDARGVEYQLDIPAGALKDQTEIKLTAVKDVGGWPLDGAMLAGVSMEPDGLKLLDVATLTITLADAMPDDKLSTLGYAFSGAGEEFHLQPTFEKDAATGFTPQQNGGAHFAIPSAAGKRIIILPVMELNVSGAGRGSADNAGSLVKDNAPTNAGAALDQKQAAAAAETDELAPLKNIKDTRTPYEKEARAAAQSLSAKIYNDNNCAELNSSMVAFQKWRYKADFEGLSADETALDESGIWSELVEKTKNLLDKAADECKKSGAGKKKKSVADVGCLQSILDKIANPPATRSGFWNDFQNKMTSKYGANVAADYQKKLKQCNPTAFEASGNSGGITFSGGSCDITQPFHINGVGNGGSWTATFIPASDSNGDILYSGGGSGCTESGSGDYTIEMNDDGSGFITMNSHGTLTCPGMGSKKGDRTFTILITARPESACP